VFAEIAEANVKLRNVLSIWVAILLGD